MTHGEELGSEMQQDSVVLTYLEGLLMHQVAGGSDTAVDKRSSVQAEEEQNFKISGNIFSSCQSDGSNLSTTTSQGSGMLHLKKARLLQSSEDWNTAKRRRLSDSIVDLNGIKKALLAGVVESVPKGKQDSALLASLLQSFSSRLQSVALSQQIRQSLKEQGYSFCQESLQEKEKDLACFGAASSHLKTLLKKSKVKDQKLDNNFPNLPKKHPGEPFTETSHTGQSGTKDIGEPLSCAAKLQAVASMVERGPSPAISPKPSVACSQLALLLSSEAHLQQYSREHALKAQSASQLASERLATMARLQECTQKDHGQLQISERAPSNLNDHTRCSKIIPNANNMAPFQNPTGITHLSPKTLGYKSSVERNNLKSSPNNSLLLHLLKSQNITKRNEICEQNGRCNRFEDNSIPMIIDESSDNPSFTDGESSHSSCIPIDLSFKQRTMKPELSQPASLNNLTQSLLHNWDPNGRGFEIIKESKESSRGSPLKPHQKVTLLQLLLGHKSDENLEKSLDPQGPQNTVDSAKFNMPIQTGTQTSITESTNINRMTPLNTPPLLRSANIDSPINLSHQPLAMKHNSPPYICSIQPERLINPASRHLIDLTKNKELQGTKQHPDENAPNSSSFSASKLLQNLAQCGMQTSMSVDEQRSNKQLLNVSPVKPLGLINSLHSPLLSSKSSTFKENGTVFSNPPTPADPGLSGSEIENLLERRTVLQLLLGAPSKSSKSERKLLKGEGLQEQKDKGCRERTFSMKIKKESPKEESSISHRNEHHLRDTIGNKFLGMAPLPQKSTGILLAPDDVKREPLSPQDFSSSKNGLLSRLLIQNHESYSPEDLDASQKINESALPESKSLCTVPKKRKLMHTEPLETHIKKIKSNTPESPDTYISSPEVVSGPFLHQYRNNFLRNDPELKYFTGHGLHHENEHRSCSRESKSFNVLKQLLLSENCVRDLALHRNTGSEEKVKDSKNSSMNRPEFSVSSLHASVGYHIQQNNCADHRTFQYPVLVKSPALSLPENLGSIVSRPEPCQFTVCPMPVDKTPFRWVITGMDKNENGKDSPRLTKTNPILYYMLQKGGSSFINQEAQGKVNWVDSPFTEKVAHATFKEKLVPDTGAKSHFLNLSPNGHMGSRASNHNGNGEAYGLFEKVLTIKKEPE
uniref:Nuclear receptor-interacting protein 1 n=1 Tax=Geotrypetes seraphini TaxID=260995 RepID=A0A6P8QFA4_GEOSA|nr:nuclear receptor-interacting protein 1 [Geotrypetes seraphini]XP_033797736.1 nuclear receptor-interacting protein 1 [Geotrypetes seraphini]XP_033797737.1 nuclear receptor-interacting protein 1 [Geotrypetes seraphini]XP_033797738.1 nuclear receptor-interacting protein 1 [Geotrypetes seraphini]